MGSPLNVHTSYGPLISGNNAHFMSYSDGVPMDGVAGHHPGSMTIDTTNGEVYRNNGTNSSTKWAKLGGQTAYVVTDFGAAGDGVTDDTTAVQAAITAAADQRIYFPPGTYVCNDTLNIDPSSTVIFDNVTLDFSAQATFTSATSLRFYGGAQTSLPAQSGNEVAGNRTWVSASAHGLAVGDVVVVENTTNASYSAYDNDFKKKERFVVREVPTTTTFETTEGCKLAWTAAESTWTKMPNETPTIRGSCLVIGRGNATGGDYCLWVENCIYPRISGVRVRSADVAGIGLKECFAAVVDGVDALKEIDDGGAGLSYGVSVASCQDVRVVNSRLHGDRHGLAIGGVGLNIGIHTSNCTLTSSSQYAADMHGNTLYSSYKNCEIPGGMTIGGNHNEVSDCTVGVAPGHTIAILLAQCTGLNHRIVDNRVTGLVASTYGVFSNVGVNCTEGGTLVIDNLKSETPASAASGTAIQCQDDATGPTAAISYDVSNVTMSNHDTASTWGILINGDSGTAPDTVRISNCRTTGGIFVGNAARVHLNHLQVVNPSATTSFNITDISDAIHIVDCVSELIASGGYYLFNLSGPAAAPLNYMRVMDSIGMGATACNTMIVAAEADIVDVRNVRTITAPSSVYFNIAATVAEFRLSEFHFPAYSATLGGTKHYLDVTGVGTPEAALVGSVGSMVRRTDGGANTTLYVKEANDTNAGWEPNTHP